MSDPGLPPNFRSGMVSIVGRPNVGKSTLLNKIVGEKVTIVSKVPQTTRNRVRGIYNDERGQIVFIDTPGMLLGRDTLDQILIQSSVGTLNEVDCVIHLVDASEPTGKEEAAVVNKLKDIRTPIILGLNKIDLKGKFLPQYIALWEEVKGKPIGELDSLILMPLSGKKGTNVDKLVDELYRFLPEGPPLYPRDTVCDIPQKIVISDIIREKLLGVLRQEVPHSIAVKIENMEKSKKLTHIQAQILVERDSQKEIVIGKGGSVLKTIGTLAREELEVLMDTKIFLELHVRVEKRWRDNTSVLQELGFNT